MQWWMVWRYLGAGRKFLSLSTCLSVFGMALGVASLVVAMAVVSGYTTTLKKTVTDVVGHVLVFHGGRGTDDIEGFIREIKPEAKGFVAATPFLGLEAVVAHNKKVAGVVIEGVDRHSVSKVLNYENRMLEGEFELSENKDGNPGVLVGKGVASRFNLKVGDVFRIVMPIADSYDLEKFRPHVKKFRLTGVLDLGRHDFNERYIVADLRAAQKLAKISERVSGLRLKLEDPDLAAGVSERISSQLGYRTKYWFQVNKNLFDAAQLEKAVIFMVLLIMVIAAAFNISSTLYVSVMQRFGDISILKAMGANPSFVMKLFAGQGLLIGVIGVVLGLVLGLAACYGFMWAQSEWGLIPGEIYKLDHLEVEINISDIIAIFFAAIGICFLATVAPARRGARMLPVEGLRYE